MTWPRIAATAVLALGLATGPALAAGAAAQLAPAGVDDFTFASFAGDYTLDLDPTGHAVMRVVETIVADFPENQNRGIVRAIPITDGDVPLHIEMTSIVDENGTPWAYERDDYDGFAEFSLGTNEFLNGRTTFVLSYTVHDPVRNYDGTDEFYWDINGNGWAQPFGTVSAHVEVGPALAAALTGVHDCFLGYYGEEGGCTLTTQGGGFDTTVGPVGPYNTLTVGIAFEGGTVVQPALPRDSWIVQVAPKVLLAIMVALLVLSILVRVLVLKDARGRGTIIAQYTPPDDSDLLLDANIVARPRAGLPALFVDFAVRGLVKVVDNKPGNPTVSAKQRFSIELVGHEGASPRELGVLVTVFGASLSPGKRVVPGKLGADTGASLYRLPAAAAAAALVSGYRAKRSSPLGKLLVRASGIAVLLFIAVGVWAVWNDVFYGNVVWPGIGAVVLAIAIPNVLAPPARLTAKGAELRDYLQGMKLYLTVAEEERLRMLQSPEGAQRVNLTDKDAIVKLYERLLPYAVLWGVEDQWVQKLQASYPEGTPSWLEGDTFNSSVFSSFTSTATSSVRPIVSSSSGGGGSWSSSGGSSGSRFSRGGGFSGGGGGGGGGGGR